MRCTKRLGLLLPVTYLFASTALAADVYIYPQKGQSQEQQDRDKFECYNWAKQQTAFDPMARPQATTPPPARGARQGGVLRGAGRGAAAGAVGGAIAGDAGKGAAIGAATGGLIGGMRRRDQRVREEQARKNWEAQQQAQYNARRSEYNRAFGACLSGRGYTVR